MKATDKQKISQASWRERNKEKSNAYFKKRREEKKKANKDFPGEIKGDFNIKLEKAEIWEQRYRKAFEKAYGKIEK